MSEARAADRAGVREWLGLAVLALPCLLVSLDGSVLGLAVPRLAADLHPSAAQLLWITDSYTFLVAGALLTMGVLADRFGRRRVLLLGAAGFGAASALAAFAPDPGTLIVARALTGLAGASLMPATLSLIRVMFRTPAQLSLATGIWAASFSLGGLAGPLVGGLLLARAWWGAVFLVAVPVMAVLLVAGPVLLPESRAETRRRPDPVSAGLSLVAVLLPVHGLKALAQDGAASRTWPVSMLAGALVAVLFVRRQRRAEHAFVDGALLRRPAFAVPVAMTAVAFFTLYAHQLLVAQYLQLVLGLSAQAAGLWTVPSVLTFLAGSLLTPVVRRRAPAHVVVAAGAGLMATGLAVMVAVGSGPGTAAYLVGSVVLSAGLGPLYAVATASAVGAAPRRQAGVASAVSETGAELGGALGVAVLGSLAAAVYRARVAAGAPDGLPSGASDAARRTLGEGLAAAHALPARLGDPLGEAARQAFVDGFRVVSGVAAVLLVAAALVAVPVLRRVTREADDDGTGEVAEAR